MKLLTPYSHSNLREFLRTDILLRFETQKVGEDLFHHDTSEEFEMRRKGAIRMEQKKKE